MCSDQFLNSFLTSLSRDFTTVLCGFFSCVDIFEKKIAKVRAHITRFAVELAFPYLGQSKAELLFFGEAVFGPSHVHFGQLGERAQIGIGLDKRHVEHVRAEFGHAYIVYEILGRFSAEHIVVTYGHCGKFGGHLVKSLDFGDHFVLEEARYVENDERCREACEYEQK